MSRVKTMCAMESLIEDVPQINFVICPAMVEDCDRIFELVQVRLFDSCFKFRGHESNELSILFKRL